MSLLNDQHKIFDDLNNGLTNNTQCNNIITQEETKTNMTNINKINFIQNLEKEMLSSTSDQEDIFIYFTDNIKTDKYFLNHLIDLSSFLKRDFVTCSYNIENNQSSLKKRVLMLEIFFNFFIKNIYNLNHKKKTIFIYTKFSSCLEGLLLVQKLNYFNQNNLKTKFKTELKGLLLETPICLEKALDFIYGNSHEKLIMPTFFINGKLSFNENDFFKEYKIIKKYFLNLTEWFPEEGSENNLSTRFRLLYLQKIKFFIHKFHFLKLKKRMKFNETFQNIRKYNYEDDINNLCSYKTFTLKFEDDYHLQEITNKSKNNYFDFIMKAEEKKINHNHEYEINLKTDKTFHEKEYDLDYLCSVSSDKFK